MEWSTMEPLGASFILGDIEGDTYVPADDCEEVLEEMVENLIRDDHRTGAFRRRISLEKVLEKDLMPLLKSTKDEKIFSLVIRFLANLTQPLDACFQENNNGDILKEMENVLTEAKHLCTDVTFFQAMGNNMKVLLSKMMMEEEDRQSINHCVLLLRNLLHMRHGAASSDEHTFIAHQCLLSSFFINELDKIIITILQHKHKESWTIAITQLISFIFKDYSGSLLEPDLDDSTSNSSGEENQNMMEILVAEGTPNSRHPATVSTTRTLTNNFKKNLQICSLSGGSSCYSPEDDDFMLEIKSTHDGLLEIKLTGASVTVEGDNGSGNGSGEDLSGVSRGAKEAPNGGCDSQTNSSSMKSPRGGGGGGSGASPPNHHSNTSIEKEVMSTINSSSCLMDMDIFIAYLKKFATNIVYTGLVDLVENMMKALMTKYESVLDHSLLMWTVGFFLSFSHQQELDLAQIKEILNMDLFGFLVYEGVKNCEAVVLHHQKQTDSAVEKHRLHLVVCTLNQMFRTLLANNKTEPVKDYLHSLQKFLSHMSDLRNLFVLLIRHYSIMEQSQTYLSDLVQTNHVLMLLIEEWLANKLLHENSEFSLVSHVNQFATSKIMAKYGSLLEQEDGTRENLNIAVLTMMYHVAGSCQRHDTLIQLPILKVFSEIWMENAVREESKIRTKTSLASTLLYENEFKDLIEFVLKIFMNDAERADCSFTEKLFANAESPANQETSSLESMNTDSEVYGKELGEEEQILILSWMPELPNSVDAAKIISCRLQDHGFDHNIELVRKYLEDNGYLETRHPADSPDSAVGAMAPQPGEVLSSEDSEDSTQILEELSTVAEADLIPFLVGKVKEEGHEENLVWLQRQLMEAAYIKLGIKDPSYRIHVEEPVARFYALQNKAIPMVTRSEELAQALATPHFLYLQKCLGLYTCDDPNILFPRIPQYLTPWVLVEMASQIGSLDSVPVKFDLSTLKEDPVTVGGSNNPASNKSGPSHVASHKTQNSLRPITQSGDYQWLNMVRAMNRIGGPSGNV